MKFLIQHSVPLAKAALAAMMAGLLLPTTLCQGQGTLQVTFDEPPQHAGTSISVQQYEESGMWFRPVGAADPGNTFSRRRGGDQVPFFPDNGSAYAAAALTESLSFGFQDGGVFDLVSVDLAEDSTVLPDAVTVPLIGYRADGLMIRGDFTTDGSIDGIGPLPDFQTFYFGPEWSGLTRVEIPDWGWSLDNLVVSVPEPSTNVLLLSIGVGSVLWQLRQRY